jgi:hypothetical protein
MARQLCRGGRPLPEYFYFAKALGETAQDARYITTAPGRGYRLAQKVQQVEAGEEKQGTLVVENHFRSQVEIVEVPNPGNERKSDLGQSDIPADRILRKLPASTILFINSSSDTW